MKRQHRTELLRIRKVLVTEYHKLSDVLVSDELPDEAEQAVKSAFNHIDQAICAINEPFGIKP